MSVRKMAPQWMQARGRAAGLWWGVRTADQRPLPDFLVIGGQRCGTTSLFRALMGHPQIRRPVMHKGVNYFDLNYPRGEAWYRGHFPARGSDDRTRVFDASGYYMFHPMAAARIAHDLPGVKIVAMVRDPVERAYSAYKHELARGFEWERSFGRALDLEDARLDGEIDNLCADPTYYSFNHRHHGYRHRGEYARLLAPFIAGLGAANVLLIESERFFASPEPEFRRISAFLGIDDVLPDRFDRYNARPGAGLDKVIRKELTEHYAAHDAALSRLLGHEPVWRA
ncbi:MAG: sulfotransferase family protein [Nocardioides sp.]